MEIPGGTASAFWEPVNTTSAPQRFILTSSARNALMASTTSTRPFSRQKAEIMSISYRTPVDVSCIFTRKPV